MQIVTGNLLHRVNGSNMKNVLASVKTLEQNDETFICKPPPHFQLMAFPRKGGEEEIE